MTLLTAIVTQEQLLHIPQEVQAQLEPGQQIQIQMEQNATPQVPNQKGLAALQKVARRQEGRRHTDGSLTDQLLRDGRAGAMYGYASPE